MKRGGVRTPTPVSEIDGRFTRIENGNNPLVDGRRFSKKLRGWRMARLALFPRVAIA
jgi:hypothetical protein